jgi:hypothetical protein
MAVASNFTCESSIGIRVSCGRMAILPVLLAKHHLKQYANTFFGKAKLFTV